MSFSDIEPNYNNIIALDGVDGTSDYSGYDVADQQVVDSVRTIAPAWSITITPELAENASGNDSYKWFKDGVELAGATDRVLTIYPTTTADAGLYTYEVTNSVIRELTLKSHASGEGITINTDLLLFLIGNDADNGNNDGTSTLTADQLNALPNVSGAVAEYRKLYKDYIKNNADEFSAPALETEI